MKIQVGERQVCYGTGSGHAADDAPAILFIHGAGFEHSVWVMPARYFARHGYRVFAPDLPEHGKTDGPPCQSIEAMADFLSEFLTACGAVVADGGMMFFATLNRTAKAFALAIVGAEYVLRWLPRGTHDWRKFVRPSELTRSLARADIEVADLTGVTYSPLTDQWSLNRRDLAVNYMGMGEKAG